MDINTIIDKVLDTEGGYVNDPLDSGGETNWGITVKVARENGYLGDMEDMPKAVAHSIYYKQYVIVPGFDKIMAISEQIAEELIDTGVNMGVSVAGRFLQRALNALNNQSTDYPDLVVDGKIGNTSINALKSFLNKRGNDGEVVLLMALNSLQAVRYLEISEARPKNERFLYGWIRARVKI